MYRYTTPTLVFKLPFEASELTEAYITLEQKNVTIEKGLSDCMQDEKTLSLVLSQEETGQLEAQRGTAVQLRCKDGSGKVYASKIFNIQIDDVLKEGEI